MQFSITQFLYSILISLILVQLSIQDKLQFIVSPYYPAVICKQDSQSLEISGIQIEIVREAFALINYKENTDYSFTCEKNFKELTNSIENQSFLTNTTFSVGIDSSGISSYNLALGYKYSQPIFSGNYVVIQHHRHDPNYFTNTVKAYIIFLIFVGFCVTYYAIKYSDAGKLGWVEYSFIVMSSFFLNREPLINHAKTRSILYGFYLLSGVIALFGIAVFIYSLLQKQTGKNLYTIYGDSQASLIINKLNAQEVDYVRFNNTSTEYLNYFNSQNIRYSLHKEYQALTLLSNQCDGQMHLIALPYYQYDALVYNNAVADSVIQTIDSALLKVLSKKSFQLRAREYQTQSSTICLATPSDYIRFFYGIRYLDLWGLFLVLWLLPLIWLFRRLQLAYYKKYHPKYYKEAKQEGIIEVISYQRAKDCGILVDQELKQLQKNLEQEVIKRDEVGVDPLVEYLLDDRQIPMDQIKQAFEKSKQMDYTPFKRLNSNVSDSFNSMRSMGLKSPQKFKGFVKNHGDTSIDRQNFGGFDSLMPTNQDGIPMTPLQDYFRLKFGQNQPDNSNFVFFQTLNRKHQNQQEGVGIIRMLSSIQPPNTDISALHEQILANNSHDGSLQFGSLYQTDEEKKNRFRFNIVKQPRNQQGDPQILSSQIKKSNLKSQNSIPLNDFEEDYDIIDDINQQYYNQFHNLKKQKSKQLSNEQNGSKLRLKQNNFMDLDEMPSPQKQKSDNVIDLEELDNSNNHTSFQNSPSKYRDGQFIPYEHKGKENMFIRNIKRSHTGFNRLSSFITENQEDLEKDYKIENPQYRVQPSAKQLLDDLDHQSVSHRIDDEKKQRKVLEHQKSIVDNFFDQQKVLVIQDNDLTVEVLTFREDDKKDNIQVYDLDAHRNYSSNRSTNR